MIKTLIIYLDTPKRAECFCNEVSRYTSDYDLRHGKREVDAKSLLGVLTLPLMEKTVLYGDISTEMENALRQFSRKEEK